MNLSWLDILIIVVYFTVSLSLGIVYTRRASKTTGEFFLSGRSIPWWLAGTSMVATSFSSDTPLYVTGLVRSEGIYENWQWWCFILSGMLSVFFFARLWRNLGVVTDVELIDMRYAGRSASVLRGFKAIYFSTVIHTIIKAQVILAMVKILDVVLGWGKWESIAVSTVITLAYATLSGYWGVVVTDFLQFILAMAGSILLAIIAVGHAGGISTMVGKIPAGTLAFFPPAEDGLFSAVSLTFLGYIGLSWWSKYSSDGGGVIVQRMASCRNDRESLLATFYFNIANYGLRTWPWILTALASLIIYPVTADNETVYPRMVAELLPSGIKGLVIASFFAAFMSTLSTYLNLSSAYFLNDFYRPFIRENAPEAHYIAVSRWITIVFSLLTAIATYKISSIVGVFKFLIAFGSGTGLVYILRWFWWRINAWSEISAMIASTVTTLVLYLHSNLSGLPYYTKLFLIISASTLTWIVVTLVTPPVQTEKLIDFYRKTSPGGPGWRRIKVLSGGLESASRSLSEQLFQWGVGSLCIISVTMGIGKALLGYFFPSFLWLSVAIITSVILFRKKDRFL